MAKDYTNLGVVYYTRGELEQAESMFRQALELNQSMNNSEGMATDFSNLGLVFRKRGKLDQAETMFRKALALFQAGGAKSQAQKIQRWLDELN